MKKQKKQALLTAIIVILVIILSVMIGSIVYEEIININNQNIQDTIAPEVNEEENIIQEEDELPMEEEVEDKTTEKSEYVGEEENELKNENVEQETPKNNDEKAIELAKKEWGDDNTVTFSVEKKKDTKFYVAVKSAATVLQWYEVDTEIWKISEY